MVTPINNAFLTDVGHIAAGSDSKLSNIAVGGQLGVGAHLPNIDAATPQVFSPAVIIVTHTPSMFREHGMSKADSILKALVERHAKSITGIDFGYTLEGQETPVGHDGQTQYMPTNTKRTAITPSMTFQELQGNLIWNFFRNWIWMINHPDTHASGLTPIVDNNELSPMVFSSFAMDIVVIQFDPTMRPENILDGFQVVNMWPQETGMFGLQRDISAGGQMQERTIPFYAMMQHNKNSYLAAQNIAKALNLHKANYSNAPAVARAIEEKLADTGIDQEIQDIMSDFKLA